MRERKKGRTLYLGNKNNCSLICGNLDNRNNDSKKSKSSPQELMVDQGSGVEQCTICKRFHKMSIGHIALDCKIGKVCYGCRFPDHIRPNYPRNKVNNYRHMVVGKGNRLGDVRA
uniref:CCHC-type domain-containing protein n=1 Tax=Lactuca sativa TaxID=4236 RepID=A0A9R1XPL2_LACSA|nr:hypothetical protein LSAT_V11C300144640 [Lactuca sativa]